jgi:hypothetical protein
VQGERAEPEFQVLPEDLSPIPVCLVFGEKDDPDLTGAFLFGIDLEEREPRKLPVVRDPGGKDIRGPVDPFRPVYSPLEKSGNLILVFEPDEYIAHHLPVVCNPPDIVEITLTQVIEDQPFCRQSKRHVVPVGCSLLIHFIRHD